MTASAALVELWSDWACNAGTRLGALTVVGGTYSDALDNTDQCTLSIIHDARVAVSLRQVVRITAADASVREYRIQSRGRTLADGTRTIHGLSPLADLASSGLVRTTTGGVTTYAVGGAMTPSLHLSTYVLANLSADSASYWSSGTIDYTAAISLTAPSTGWTRLEYLRQIAGVTGAELRARRNGDTGYLIDLRTSTGSTATAVPIALGKNLLTLQEDTDDGELATAVTEFGRTASGNSAPDSIGENAWTLGAIPGAGPFWIPLSDPSGGAAPIAFASQFGTAAGSQGAYLLLKDATTLQITDSRITPDYSVQVAATTGLTAGDLVQIVADSSATRLTELRAPGVSRLHRVDTASTLRGERNVIVNGTFATWTSDAVPVGWTSTHGYRYPRATPTTMTMTVTANAANLTSVAVNGTAGARVFLGDWFNLNHTGGGSLVDTARVTGSVTLDGSGNGTLAMTPLGGGLGAAVIIGDVLTLATTYLTRVSSFPSDVVANDVYRLDPTLSSQSPTFKVKYVAGLATLNAAFGVTEINKSGSTTVAAACAYVELRDTVGATTLATGAASADLLDGVTRHSVLTTSATISADKTIALRVFGTSGNFVASYARYVMLWLGSADIPPSFGDGPFGNQLWQRGNRALLARAISSRQLRVSLRDLSTAAGYSVTRESLTLGGTITLEDLGVSVRAIALTYSLTDPTDAQVLLDSRPTRLVKFLAERV